MNPLFGGLGGFGKTEAHFIKGKGVQGNGLPNLWEFYNIMISKEKLAKKIFKLLEDKNFKK